jgi:hypothetical protein
MCPLVRVTKVARTPFFVTTMLVTHGNTENVASHLVFTVLTTPASDR